MSSVSLTKTFICSQF